MVKGQNFQEDLSQRRSLGQFPTAISVVIVEGLGMPGAGVLIEIDAIAVIEGSQPEYRGTGTDDRSNDLLDKRLYALLFFS